MSSPFAGTKFVEGLGWVESGGSPGTGALHGEADVMMISGLGHDNGLIDDHHGLSPPATVSSQNGQIVGSTGSFSLKAALTQKVSILGIELPAFVWALIALGALGAGYVFFKKLKR